MAMSIALPLPLFRRKSVTEPVEPDVFEHVAQGQADARYIRHVREVAKQAGLIRLHEPSGLWMCVDRGMTNADLIRWYEGDRE